MFISRCNNFRYCLIGGFLFFYLQQNVVEDKSALLCSTIGSQRLPFRSIVSMDVFFIVAIVMSVV